MNKRERLTLRLRKKKRDSLFFKAGQESLNDFSEREFSARVKEGKIGMLRRKNVEVPDE